MNPVYLLLRNNEQTGPYSLEDLPALQLTEKDMVKVAGSNSGWFYPYELGLPFVLSTRMHKQEEEQPLPNRVEIETDPANVDQTIEELSKKITAMRNNLRMVEEKIQAEKEGIPLKRQAAKKQKRSPRLLWWAGAAVLVALFGITTVFLVRGFSRPSPPAAHQENLQEAGQPGALTEPQTFGYQDVPDLSRPDSIITGAAAETTPGTAAAKAKRTPPRRQRNRSGPVEPLSSGQDHIALNPEELQGDRSVALNYVDPEEEKKTLLQKIGEIFKKKEEPTPVRNPITEETISDKLKVKISTTNYSWLKGVQGLTLTMHNNSDQEVRQAIVHVIYYTKEDAVIERSTVRFTNIKPGKWQGVAAPDHPWADHAGYEIISVSVVKK